MKPLATKSLDWIARAPVRVTRSRRISADPDRVWAAIADHESWPAWFRAVTRVERRGTGEGVGGRRRVHIRSTTIDEEFLAWEPGKRFAFTVTHTNRPGMRSIVEEVRLDRDGDGTTVSYTQAFDPVAAVVTAPLLRRVLPRVLDEALAGLDRHVTS